MQHLGLLLHYWVGFSIFFEFVLALRKLKDKEHSSNDSLFEWILGISAFFILLSSIFLRKGNEEFAVFFT
jgi:hypothetical protein